MFHGKPLYLAIAQRKVDRQMQLRNQFAQRMAAMLGQSTIFQGGCTPYYYPAPCVVPQVPSRSGLTFQPLGMNPAWRANAFTSPARPAFQPTPVPIVSCNFSWIKPGCLLQPSSFCIICDLIK